MTNPEISLFATIGSRRGYKTRNMIDARTLPHASMFYSLYGEDSYLRSIFKQKLHDGMAGTYVDVGCAGPFSGSNTAFFYTCGWRGLCVDANSAHQTSFAKWRPEDKFVRAAVGDVPGELPYYRNVNNKGMGTIGQSHPGAGFEGPELVPVRRLDDLLAENLGDKEIDFMTIDVEGAEFGVVNSNDWNRYRPKAVLIECVGFDFASPFKLPALAHMRGVGYRLEGKIGESLLMLRD